MKKTSKNDEYGGMTIEQQDVETAYGRYPYTDIDCYSVCTNV